MLLRGCVAFGLAAMLGGLAIAQDAAAGGEAKLDAKAPDFKMTGIDGKEFAVSDLTSAGKNVVLIFDRAHW